MSLLMQLLAKGTTFGRLNHRSKKYKITDTTGWIPQFQPGTKLSAKATKETESEFSRPASPAVAPAPSHTAAPVSSSCQLNLDEAFVTPNCKQENPGELFPAAPSGTGSEKSGGKAFSSPWFWFEEEPNPFLAETPLQCSGRMQQGELAFSNLQVKRNDLSDTDLELIAAPTLSQLREVSDETEPAMAGLEPMASPWATLVGWQSLAARLLRAGRSVLF